MGPKSFHFRPPIIYTISARARDDFDRWLLLSRQRYLRGQQASGGAAEISKENEGVCKGSGKRVQETY